MILVKVAPTSRCPFCDGTWTPCVTAPEGTPALTHSMPTCAKFRQMDVDEFIAAVHADHNRKLN